MRTQLEGAAGKCNPVDRAVLVRVVVNGDDELGWGGGARCSRVRWAEEPTRRGRTLCLYIWVMKGSGAQDMRVASFLDASFLNLH